MKVIYFTLFLISGIYASNAQITAGLVAHWDMNGSANDVSGHGLNGHLNNCVPVAGMSGVPNTAYSFNGLNSWITVPYTPLLDITQYSICAKLKVSGFYTGACHANMIFTRGAIQSPGNYSLYFYDAPYTGSCSVIDTNEDFMTPSAGGHTMPGSAWIYSPATAENVWYTVVATWDGTQWQVYVNGALKVSNISTGGTFGASTDSITIGADLFDALAGHPYYFNGIIDDILLYNRALSDSEVLHIGDTCGVISLQPVNSILYVGGSAIYTVNSTISGVSYQWQQDAGTGFVNLTNAGQYSGVTTNTLTIAGVTSVMNNYHYRCLLSNSIGCNDTTTTALLLLKLGVNNLRNNEAVLIYPDPAQNELNITDESGISSINITNLLGQTVYKSNFNTSNVKVDISNLPNDMYLIIINGTLVRRFLKQ